MPVKQSSSFNLSFYFHLLVTGLAWVGPFLFNWKWMVAAYLLVQFQFQVFGKCLVNEQHDLSEEDNYTFYAYLMESLGWSVNRKKVKTIVRGGLYIGLAAFTILWQVGLGFESVIF